MGTREEIVAALDDDGATYIERDGRVWTMKIEPDECSNIFDEQGEGVWCGQLGWSEGSNDYGWPVRPDWADGGAEILERDHHAALWWRPLDDCLADRELRALVRETVCDLIQYGYVGVVVETDDGHSASLWGVETFPDAGYVAGIVGELVDEIRDEIERDEIARVRATFGLLDAVR